MIMQCHNCYRQFADNVECEHIAKTDLCMECFTDCLEITIKPKEV